MRKLFHPFILSLSKEKITKRLDKPVAFLLPLFLLIPSAAQCIHEKQKTIQNIRNDREDIYKEREPYASEEPLDYFLFQDNWNNFVYELYKEKNYKSHWQKLILPRIAKKKGYSFLGLTTIALKDAIDRPFEYFERLSHLKKTLLNRHQASFYEKKEFIQLLLPIAHEIGNYYRVDITPTPEDKEFALLEKWERCALTIIKKINIFQHAPLLSEIKTERKAVGQETSLMQQNFIRYVSLLMWELEESLF